MPKNNMSKSNMSKAPIIQISGMESIAKNFFKYYEYKYFSNLQVIGFGEFGKVYRANWKDSHEYFALKSLRDTNNVTIKEIINEVIKT